MNLEAQKAARAELEADLEALRRHNVKTFNQHKDGFSVEFWPAQPPELKDPAKKLDEDDLCGCGHHLGREHMNGFCIHTGCAGNCDAEKKP